MANSTARTDGLMQIIDDQKREIEKYRTKLRDIVLAHRNLIKEKEALEDVINSLKPRLSDSDPDGASKEDVNETEDSKQIAALINSLNTLRAEKSRLESSYQADKKTLREEKEVAEAKLLEIRHKLEQAEAEAEEYKSRMIIERHERDKEQADHGAIMKELQSLLSSERSARMRAEDNYAELRKRNSGNANSMLEKYQQLIERLEKDLDVTKRKLELAEKRITEPPRELIKLKDEIRNLQVDHQNVIQQERCRSELAEELAKRQALIQEERVITLEAKLAELSSTVGSYDRLRQQDQYEILKLKEKVSCTNAEQTFSKHENDVLESELPVDNVSAKDSTVNPQNMETVTDNGLLTSCLEELDRVRREFDRYKMEMKLKSDTGSKNGALEELVRTLQERLRMMKEELLKNEKMRYTEVDQLKHLLRAEKNRYKEKIVAIDNDYRGKINVLELELQKLRERSMALIEDKDQEIHSLQGTFQTFLPVVSRAKESPELPTLSSMRDGPRMLHYANELARRDVDIAALRRAKHKVEATLRKMQLTAVNDAELHREEKAELLDEINRLKLRQTREGANMEYLKNVVLNFLLSNDPLSKRHMCNAIAAVLKFNEQELERIAKQAHNSWWNSGKVAVS